MKEERIVYTYVVTDGTGDEKVITGSGHMLATTQKKAEKKVMSELKTFNEDTEVLISTFCGRESQ